MRDMELKPIEEISTQAWDAAIDGYEERQLYHRSPWLRFLEETQAGRLLRFRIVEAGATVGYFPAMTVKKGIFTLLGSPLTGWLTDCMGPVADRDLAGNDFLLALEELCRRRRVDFLQIGSPLLAPEVMGKLGYGITEMNIFSIPLSGSRDQMWNHLDSKCRNRIRKALANGLEIRESTDEAFVDEYYAQHTDVFARQGLPPKYSVQVVRSLFRNLMALDQLLCLKIVQGERPVASGLFPHDDRHLYSFGIASWGKDLHLSPNELLYWTAMCLGRERGLRALNIGGNYRVPATGGNFKKKFNGEEVTLYRYTKNFGAPARIAHRAYQMFLRLKRKPGWSRPIRPPK
jgi:hypothetical protein